MNNSKIQYGNDAVDSVLNVPPFERTRAYDEGCAWSLENEIDGILIGFAAILKARGGHIDLITTKVTANEIKCLIANEIDKYAQRIKNNGGI